MLTVEARKLTGRGRLVPFRAVDPLYSCGPWRLSTFVPGSPLLLCYVRMYCRLLAPTVALEHVDAVGPLVGLSSDVEWAPPATVPSPTVVGDEALGD